MRPVPPGADTRNVAEVVRRILFREVFGRERMTRLRSIDVETNRPLVERLQHVVAVRIENFPKLELVNSIAFRIHFDDEVANRVNALVVRTTEVRRRDAKECMAVLSLIECVRIVGVTERQATIEYFAAEHVVLGVALTVAKNETAVVRLLETHHDAGLVRLFRIVHVVVREQIPTNSTG